MREKQNNWQRIEAVIKWANMSTNYFARHIGLARGENLYQIKRGNNGISLDVADRIVAKFPQVDKLWLLTGEGQMFADARTRGPQIPFYDVDVRTRAETSRTPGARKQSDSLPGGGVRPGDVLYGPRDGGARTARDGGAAEGRGPRCDYSGGEYAIVSRKIVTLRIVRAADEEDKVRLVAGDRENYDDILLNVSDIVAVYKVKGKLIINS